MPTAPTSGFSSAIRSRPSATRPGRPTVWTIAFSSTLDDTRQIYVVRADGNGLRRLTGVRRAFTRTETVARSSARAGRTSFAAPLRMTTSVASAATTRSWGSPATTSSTAAPAADRIDGGTGVDTLLGAAGDDLLLARDGKRDDVDGGPGNDRARVDHQDWISLMESLLYTSVAAMAIGTLSGWPSSKQPLPTSRQATSRRRSQPWPKA